MIREFRKNNKYLVTYELKQLAFMSLLVFLFTIWNPWELQSLSKVFLISIPLLFSAPIGYFVTTSLLFFYFNPADGFDITDSCVLAILGICFGLVHSQLVHFCSHNLLRPKWINRVLGEVLSLQFLGTYLGFTVLHLEHHTYADDLVLDPHPNQAEGFYRFFVKLTKTMAVGFKKIYFKHHADKPETQKIWLVYKYILPTRCFSRVVFLILLLGPSGFLFFLLPSMIANYWVFGHLNYYSHLRKPDGTVEILNLDQKVHHKILNYFTLGAYNHADHHKFPAAMNPSLAKKVKL